MSWDEMEDDGLGRAAKKIWDSLNKLKAEQPAAQGREFAHGPGGWRMDEPFDRADAYCAMARWHVENLLKKLCNVRRRAPLPQGPVRRSPAQGGGHGR